MRWQGRELGAPRRIERRQADVTALALQAIQARASLAGSRETAAREMAAGLISRALAGAKVEGPGFVQAAVTPGVLAQIGRDLVVAGESLHVIRVTPDGSVRLFPSSGWSIIGDYDPASWIVAADLSGPSRTITRTLAYSGVVHIAWGVSPQSPHAGRGPLEWAALTSKLNAETERSLGDEASGPIAQLLPMPSADDGEDADGEPETSTLKGLIYLT